MPPQDADEGVDEVFPIRPLVGTLIDGCPRGQAAAVVDFWHSVENPLSVPRI